MQWVLVSLQRQLFELCKVQSSNKLHGLQHTEGKRSAGALQTAAERVCAWKTASCRWRHWHFALFRFPGCFPDSCFSHWLFHGSLYTRHSAVSFHPQSSILRCLIERLGMLLLECLSLPPVRWRDLLLFHRYAIGLDVMARGDVTTCLPDEFSAPQRRFDNCFTYGFSRFIPAELKLTLVRRTSSWPKCWPYRRTHFLLCQQIESTRVLPNKLAPLSIHVTTACAICPWNSWTVVGVIKVMQWPLFCIRSKDCVIFAYTNQLQPKISRKTFRSRSWQIVNARLKLATRWRRVVQMFFYSRQE